MTSALLAEAPPAMDRGMLAANGMTVSMLQSALSRAEMNVGTIPKIIKNIHAQDAWRAFLLSDDPESEPYTWNTADFRRFIEEPRPRGCQTPIAVLEKVLRDTPAWELFLKLTRGMRGNPGDWENQPRSNEGSFMGRNRNNITVTGVVPDESPAEPPPAPEPPPPRVRDYTRESKQGTSVSYAIRRLERDRPDLLEKVKAGGLSPHAAMVAAGFIAKAITIPDEPAAAARRLLLHFRGERLAELIAGLVNPPPAGSPSPESPPHVDR